MLELCCRKAPEAFACDDHQTLTCSFLSTRSHTEDGHTSSAPADQTGRGGQRQHASVLQQQEPEVGRRLRLSDVRDAASARLRRRPGPFGRGPWLFVRVEHQREGFDLTQFWRLLPPRHTTRRFPGRPAETFRQAREDSGGFCQRGQVDGSVRRFQSGQHAGRQREVLRLQLLR